MVNISIFPDRRAAQVPKEMVGDVQKLVKRKRGVPTFDDILDIVEKRARTHSVAACKCIGTCLSSKNKTAF